MTAKMMARFLLVFFLMPLTLGFSQKAGVVCNPAIPAETQVQYWKYHDGDRPDFASADVDDSNWEIIHRDYFPKFQNPGIFWLRSRITLTGEVKDFPLLLRLGRLQTAFEVYLNGQFIGSNGQVALTGEKEVSGKLFYAVLLNPHIHRGDNTLAIRVSNFNFIPPGFFFYAKLDSRLNANLFFFELQLRMAIFIGISLAGSILGLSLFLIGKQYFNFFFYFLLCFSFFISTTFRFLMHFRNIPLKVLKIFEPIYVGSFYLVEISTVLFVLFLFKFHYKKLQILLVSLISLIIYLSQLLLLSTTLINYTNYRYLMLVYLNCLILYACWKRKKGSVIALIGYFLFTLPRYEQLGVFNFPEELIAFSSSLLVIVYILVVNRQVEEQQKIQRAIELKAQRLETEVMKKAIQPHFLMNTLASWQSWSKRNPQKAEQMTQAIANEFRGINQVMSEKLIPLEDELELCRNHLQLMGFRRDANYGLHVESMCSGCLVPPLVFHTLVENGLTHAMRPQENGIFIFSCLREKGATNYSLRNNGSLLEAMPPHASIDEEGTGLKYVKSRLEESFPRRWSLCCGLQKGMWQVDIVIREK